MKRFVCFLLALVMIVGLLPATVLTARAASELETSDKAIEIIKQFEGFSAKAYQDGAEWYIGYGTWIADPSIYVDGITPTEATTLLRNHIHADDDAANKTVDEHINAFAQKYNLAFTQYQHDALAVFTYNCGHAWMYSQGAFRDAVVNGKTGVEFLNAICLWNGVDPNSDYFRGLMNRRLAEANMYLNNLYNRTAPANYTYVVLDYNGGSVATDAYGNHLNFYAYDSSTSPAIGFAPQSGSDRFLGWTLDGKPISILDASTSKKTLVATWQSGETEVKVSYEINSSECASLKVYAEHSNTAVAKGELKANSKFTVTKEYRDANGVKWLFGTGVDTKGKAIKGWVGLKDMDEVDTTGDKVLATGTVTATELNVRKSATIQGDLHTGTLKKGDIVKILAYKNEYTAAGVSSWGKIMFNGQIGWINLAYVDTRAVADNDNDSVYGKTGVIVNAENVNIRPGAGVHTGTPVAQLAAGTKVTVYETEQVGTATWGRIKWDGIKEGWVYLYYVKMDDMNLEGSAGEGAGTGGEVLYNGVVTSNTNLNIRALPSVSSARLGSLPKGTKISIYEKTVTNRVEWGRTDKGWVCLQYVSLTATGAGTGTGSGATGGGNHVLKTDVGTITAATLTLRKTATNNSQDLGTLKKGDQVTILERVTETTSTGSKLWGKVTVNGVTGYINLAYVDIKPTTTLIPDTDGAGSGSDSGATPKNGVISGCVTVNVRASAGVRSALVKTLAAGTAITVYEQIEHESAPWANTDHGWICMYYITLSGDADNGGTTGGTTSGGTINGTTPGVISATGIVSSNTDLNVRSGAGLAFPKVSALKKGTQVTIYEQVSADGMTWGKTSDGWVCMSYITINGTTDSGKGVMGTIARCFNAVNVRSAPGTGNALVGTIMVGTRVEIFEQKPYGGQYWGRVAQGWICMQYVALDGELPPEATEPTTPSEPDEDTNTSTGSGVVNTNASVTFNCLGTTNKAVNVHKDATALSDLAGTLNSGMNVQIVALKYNRNEETGLPEYWGKTNDYGTPGWINLEFVNLNLKRYAQFDKVTVYAAAGTDSEDLALLKLNAEVYVTELALNGNTVWGKIDLDSIPAEFLYHVSISGLVGWVPMGMLGTDMVYTVPVLDRTDLTGKFVGVTYSEINAYTNVLATEVIFKLRSGADVTIHELNLDHGEVWGKVKGTDFYGNAVDAWVNVSGVRFQIRCNVTAPDGLNVRTVPFGNDDTTIKGVAASGEQLTITSLQISNNGELWGQIQHSDPNLNGGWVNMSFTNAPTAGT